MAFADRCLRCGSHDLRDDWHGSQVYTVCDECGYQHPGTPDEWSRLVDEGLELAKTIADPSLPREVVARAYANWVHGISFNPVSHRAYLAALEELKGAQP